MRTNIEVALNELIVSNKDITIANAIPAYLRTAGFTGVTHDALKSFEHAMDKYPALSNRSRSVSGKQVKELMTEYWIGKLSTTFTLACPCSGCGKKVSVDSSLLRLEQLDHPQNKRRLREKKTRRVNAKRDIAVAVSVSVDPSAPSTSAVTL